MTVSCPTFSAAGEGAGLVSMFPTGSGGARRGGPQAAADGAALADALEADFRQYAIELLQAV